MIIKFERTTNFCISLEIDPSVGIVCLALIFFSISFIVKQKKPQNILNIESAIKSVEKDIDRGNINYNSLYKGIPPFTTYSEWKQELSNVFQIPKKYMFPDFNSYKIKSSPSIDETKKVSYSELNDIAIDKIIAMNEVK